MRWSNLNKQKTALRILMRNVFIFHNTGSTSLVKYFNEEFINSASVSCQSSLAGLGMLSLSLLYCQHGPCWGSESLCCHRFVFWVLMKVILPEKNHSRRSFQHRLAEWDGCAVPCKYKRLIYVLFNYFRNISVFLDKLTLLLLRSNTALKNYLIPSALG